MSAHNSSLPSIATALLIGLLGGSLFNCAGLPLPWMLGPLFCFGAAGISGVRVGEIRGGRQAGQLVVGAALGLYFSLPTWRLLQAIRMRLNKTTS